jgi:maltose O-acetyltransferase
MLIVRFFFTFVRILKRYSSKAYYFRIYGVDTSFISGFDVDIYGDGTLKVGRFSYIGNRSSIQVSKNYSIFIGENVSISHNVRIYTSGRSTEYIINPLYDGDIYHFDNVSIGNNVWIGTNVVITHGVAICDNVVVGANTVVTRSIIEPGVYVGSPMRKVVKIEKY